MEESIGNAGTRAIAWAERTVRFLSPLAEKASRRLGTRTFSFKYEVSSPHQNLNTPTTEEPGQLAHELPYFTRQTHIQQLPYRRSANRDPGSKSVAFTESHTINRTILPAPAQNTNLTTELQDIKSQNRTSKKVVTKVLPEKRSESTPCIDVGEVADRVYHLMRHDLVLERERSTRLGG